MVISFCVSHSYCFYFLSGSFARPDQRCSPDAGGEEAIAGRTETAGPRCQPIRAAERQERATMGHQGLTSR